MEKVLRVNALHLKTEVLPYLTNRSITLPNKQKYDLA